MCLSRTPVIKNQLKGLRDPSAFESNGFSCISMLTVAPVNSNSTIRTESTLSSDKLVGQNIHAEEISESNLRNTPRRGNVVLWSENDKREYFMALHKELIESVRTKRQGGHLGKPAEFHHKKPVDPIGRRIGGLGSSLSRAERKENEEMISFKRNTPLTVTKIGASPRPVDMSVLTGRHSTANEVIKRQRRDSVQKFLNRSAKERKRQEVEKRRSINRLQNDLYKRLNSESVAF